MTVKHFPAISIDLYVALAELVRANELAHAASLERAPRKMQLALLASQGVAERAAKDALARAAALAKARASQ